MKIDARIEKALKGTKVAGVVLWISCVANIVGASISLLGSLVAGNAASFVTALITGGMAFFFGWMARSINALTKLLNGEETEESESEQNVEE